MRVRYTRVVGTPSAGFPTRFRPEQLAAETRRLRRFTAVLAGQPADADDLAQSALLRTLESEPRHGGDLGAWLRTVATNAWRNGVVARLRRQQREEAAARPEGTPEEDLVERAELHRAVMDAVLALDEPYRSTLLLRYFEDLPPRAIARRQSVPVATVRTRVARALALLRDRLDRRYGARRSWCLIAVGGAGKLAAASGATGVILMALKTKVLAAGALLLVAGGFAWLAGNSARSDAGRTIPPESAEAPAVVVSLEPDRAPPVTGASGDPPSIQGIPFQESRARTVVVQGRIVDRRDGAPVAGAEIKGSAWRPDGAQQAESGRSDAQGRFQLGFVPGIRDASLMIRHPEFAPFTAGKGEQQPAVSALGSVDFGEIRLERGAAVRGRVVRAGDRTPVGGASLRIVREGYGGSMIELLRAHDAGTTAPDGSFELTERVAPLRALGATLFALAPDGMGWTTLGVVPGRGAIDDVEIAVEPGGGLRVEVVDASARPVAGASLVVVPRFAPLGPGDNTGPIRWWATGGGDGRFEAITGDDGTATFHGLPFGRSDERFHNNSKPSNYDVVARAGGCPSSCARAVLARNAMATARVVLEEAKTVTLAGRIVDVTGAGIPDATITVRGRAGGDQRSGGDGSYRLEGVPAEDGKTWIVVRAESFATFDSEVLLPDGSAEIARDFQLESARPISGRVVGEDGAPVPGTCIELQKLDTERLRHLLIADAEGKFTFREATEGAWTVQVVGRTDTRRDWQIPDMRLVQGGDTGVEIVLRRRELGGARLVAEIVEAGSGTALDPIEARVRRDAVNFSGDSSESIEPARSVGRVTADELSPGRWQIEVRVRDGRRAVQPFPVRDGERDVALRLEFGAPGAITGRVEFAAGSPVPPPRSAMVMPEPNGSAKWDRRGGTYERWIGNAALVDAETGWTFRFEDVVPGRPIRFRLATSNEWSGETEVTIPPGGGEREVVLRALPAGRVTWHQADVSLAGGIVLSIAGEDGAWRPIDRSVWEPGKPWSWETSLPAGRHRWKAERFDLAAPAGKRIPASAAEGGFEIRVGESREIAVAFTP